MPKKEPGIGAKRADEILLRKKDKEKTRESTTRRCRGRGSIILNGGRKSIFSLNPESCGALCRGT